MKATLKFLPLALAICAGVAPASEAGLLQRAAQQDGWVSWRVPMVAGAGMACCFEWQGHAVRTPACDLDSKHLNFGTNDDDPHPATGGELDVYVHASHGEIDKVRTFSAGCAVRSGTPIRALEDVAPADSVALLAGVAGKWQKETGDAALAGIALHADAAATGALERLADATHGRELRKQALFWLGQARGADGATFVEAVATGDGDDDVRAEAVFALSQSHAIDAYASIHRLAEHDRARHVREQACFWMAQTGDQRAKDDLLAIIAHDADGSVREQAVFALSQLKQEQGEPALIAIVRGDYPRDVKEKALFWLGQSGSDRAMEFLDEVLTRPAGKPAKG